MFGYLRIFLVLSLLFVVSAAIAGGMFLRTLALEDLTRVVQADDASVVQGYVTTVWKRYRAVLLPLMDKPEQLTTNPRTPYFAQDTAAFFKDMSLVKVNFYNANGQLLFSSDIGTQHHLPTGVSTPDKPYVSANFRRPKPSSQVLEGVQLQGEPYGKLIQTIVPFNIENDGAKPAEGAIELLYNITTTYDKLESFQVAGTCAIIFIFITFLLILSISSRKAEAIIAKQHEANLELTKAAAEAQAENAEKSQFLANISHELRTPLNAIIGFSEIIKTELLPTLPERKYDQYVNDIHNSGVHLLSLINDILDYSKAEAGKLAIEVAEVDVTKLSQQALRLVLPRAEAASVALVDNMPKDHIVMTVDSKKLKQILLNLLSNAVKFTPAGGQVSVTAWETMSDETVTFEVADTGIGIAPKDISRAMSPFGQVDNTLKRKYEGTGLGLPLTKKFVEIMGGKFNIESELEKGTKIIFTLPKAPKVIDGVNVKMAS